MNRQTRVLRLIALLFFAAVLTYPIISSSFAADDDEDGGAGGLAIITEAPTTKMDNRVGNEDLWNGLGDLGEDPDECDPDKAPEPNRSFRDNLFIFSEKEAPEEGLGPIYNHFSCDACHKQPVTGGIGQEMELRAGRHDLVNGVLTFTQASGGNVIHMRTIVADIQEHLEDSTVKVLNADGTLNKGNNGVGGVTTRRTSLNLLGDGFVEAINNATFTQIRNGQPAGFQGSISTVANMLEAPGRSRVGRFGWKAQDASLLSFSIKGYNNELGITTPLELVDNTSMGKVVVPAFETAGTPPDPEDDGADAEAFANFIRATRAPKRGPINAQVLRGEQLFKVGGCAFCHTPAIVTNRPGSVINGGTFVVPAALGNKRIHPYSDFLLHDVGTGDGIVQNAADQASRNKMKTPALWAVRTKVFKMHDGGSNSFGDAILRHAGGGGGTFSANFFRAINNDQKADLVAFLKSL
jgi:CxxC motif-containing protein (DUF1111 family)